MRHNRLILDAAGRHLGTQEWPGAASNPAVEMFFARAGHPGLTDDVPWCAAFVGAVLAEVGLPNTGSLMARSYARWGREVGVADVMPGDIAVLSRGDPPAGHVGIVVQIVGDQVLLRGGNQGNAVTDASYPISRVVSFRRAEAAAEGGRPTLREGDRGLHVQDLQLQLAALNYAHGRADGIFGPLTKAAVMAFQGAAGLETSGVVNADTWAALRTAEPRPDRDVTLDDLRAEGSRTISNADRAEVVAAVGAVGAVGERALSAISEHSGTIDWVAGFFRENWLLIIIVLVVLAAVYVATGGIKKARVEDAREGRHLGR